MIECSTKEWCKVGDVLIEEASRCPLKYQDEMDEVIHMIQDCIDTGVFYKVWKFGVAPQLIIFNPHKFKGCLYGYILTLVGSKIRLQKIKRDESKYKHKKRVRAPP